jgi:hypothetical protein
MKKIFLILFIYINFCLYFYNNTIIIFLSSVLFLLIILFKKYEDKLIFQLTVTSLISLLLLEILITKNIFNNYLFSSNSDWNKLIRTNNFYKQDKELLYDLIPGVINKDVKINYNSRNIDYNGKYTIDKNSLRLSTNTNENYNTIFLGCSFMFGEGLDDEETLPSQLNKINNLKSINLGVSGYGFLQSKHKAKKFINVDVKNVIYFSLPMTHSSRDKGYANDLKSYSQEREDNKINNILNKKIKKNEEKDIFFKKIINRFNDHLIFISNIPETFATIRLIKRFYRSYFSNYDYNYTKEYYENLYNYKKELENLGIQFYIVVFDYELEKKSNIAKELKEIFKENLFLTSDIFKGIHKDEFLLKYTFKIDGHPNYLFNLELAEYLNKNIFIK